MRYVNDFNTTLALRRYDLRVEDNHVIIRYNRILPSEQNQELPDEEMIISQMHIANIPAILSAIQMVFQSKEGNYWTCKENGDNLTVAMGADDHGRFHDLRIRDNSNRIKNALTNTVEFVFEDLILINHPPLPRTPTPAMIWVTDTLKKIHEEWEERKKGTPE